MGNVNQTTPTKPTSSSSGNSARVAELMAQMAAGDQAAIWALCQEFRSAIAATVAFHLRQLGHQHLISDDDFIDTLVIDVGVSLFDVAGAWDPSGGAMPWSWARHTIRQTVRDAVAVATVGIDGDPVAARAGPGAALDQTSTNETGATSDSDHLASLAVAIPEVQLLQAAIHEVASNRDQQIHIAYQLRKADGTKAASEAVATLFDLTAANVRQINSRTIRKLRQLAATDTQYGPIGELAWLA